MFLNCFERKETAYFEFQYCKNIGITKTCIKRYKFWEPDSLLVHSDEDEFFSIYRKYLESPDGRSEFDPFGPNYYTKEHTNEILRTITEEKPVDWEILAKWLGRAITYYNGFYFLGV